MLAGKRAVITGADSGIGRAVAISFAREGADILIFRRGMGTDIQGQYPRDVLPDQGGGAAIEGAPPKSPAKHLAAHQFPLLLGLARDCRRRRVLDLDPAIRRPARLVSPKRFDTLPLQPSAQACSVAGVVLIQGNGVMAISFFSMRRCSR